MPNNELFKLLVEKEMVGLVIKTSVLGKALGVDFDDCTTIISEALSKGTRMVRTTTELVKEGKTQKKDIENLIKKDFYI